MERVHRRAYQPAPTFEQQTMGFALTALALPLILGLGTAFMAHMKGADLGQAAKWLGGTAGSIYALGLLVGGTWAVQSIAVRRQKRHEAIEQLDQRCRKSLPDLQKRSDTRNYRLEEVRHAVTKVHDNAYLYELTGVAVTESDVGRREPVIRYRIDWDGATWNETELERHPGGHIPKETTGKEVKVNFGGGGLWGIDTSIEIAEQGVTLGDQVYRISRTAKADLPRVGTELMVRGGDGQATLPIDGILGFERRARVLIQQVRQLKPKATVEEVERVIGLCTQATLAPLVTMVGASLMGFDVHLMADHGELSIDSAKRAYVVLGAKKAYIVGIEGGKLVVEARVVLEICQADDGRRDKIGYMQGAVTVDVSTGEATMTWSDLKAHRPELNIA